MAVDELAVHAENNHRLLAALRSTSQKLSGVERKRAAELTHAMAVRSILIAAVRPNLIASDKVPAILECYISYFSML